MFTVVVPIVFGRTLIDPYHGFAQHRVVVGDTLSALASLGTTSRDRVTGKPRIR
jgi:hypothetical protein